MKKFLAAVFCSIPLITHAVTLGGFKFSDEDIIDKIGTKTVIEYHARDGRSWFGWHIPKASSQEDQDYFYLFTKAKGANKVWAMVSGEKGKYIHDNARSFLYLLELDCLEQRSRMMKLRIYSDHFAQGASVEGTEKNLDWKTDDPDSPNIRFGCAILEAYSN